MAALFFGWMIVLSQLLLATLTCAEELSALYDRPTLVIDPGMHTGSLKEASVDAKKRWAVTGSYDKTVRIWSVDDGSLARTIRLPAGPGETGQVLAVAISPDGALIAVGGRTGSDQADAEQIYIFDRSSGELVRRIDGLPASVDHLTFSPDGQLLVATLITGGVNVFSGARHWDEIARDSASDGATFGAAFGRDDRLVTTSQAGTIRLYSAGSTDPSNLTSGGVLVAIRPLTAIAAPDGHEPFGVAFSPDGKRLAVGYYDSPVVDLLDGNSLTPLPQPDLRGINRGNLSHVVWSSDGRTLFAGGSYGPRDGSLVLAWDNAGSGERRTLATVPNTITSLLPLSNGDLLVTSAAPSLTRFRPDGTTLWMHLSPQTDWTYETNNLSVSSDGTRIGFSFTADNKTPALFDLSTRGLGLDQPRGRDMALPIQDGLPIEGWLETPQPAVNGKVLELAPQELSHCLAIGPTRSRFVLGTRSSLRAYDAEGKLLWRRPAPGEVWAVNITGDGRLVLAAYADGTIRWHRMNDGVELLAFMPLPDRSNWVAWTPEGFYAATPGAHGIMRWHVNHGWDAPAESVPIEDISGSFRPAVLPLVLQALETPRALGLAVLAEHNKEVAIRTHSQLPPGVQLHLLAVGISSYNENYAKNLRLHYADRDAHDLASTIVNTQEGLYSRVDAQALLNQDASRGGILRGLQTLRTEMERGGGNDLAVVHFSGHGAMVDGTLYLLPYDTDARDAVGIKTTALSVDAFKGELMEMAKHGRVLVLLDACHSGATSLDGSGKAVDAAELRRELATANVTVLTSSGGSETSLEDDAWQHGAFTRALLDALNDPAADADHVGLINATALAHYVARDVSSLTDGKQNPAMEVRFDTTVFAVGL